MQENVEENVGLSGNSFAMHDTAKANQQVYRRSGHQIRNAIAHYQRLTSAPFPQFTHDVGLAVGFRHLANDVVHIFLRKQCKLA